MSAPQILPNLPTSHPDDLDDELLIALDDDPELAPYLEYFDRLSTEPRMVEQVDQVSWWRRVTGAVMTARSSR